MLSQNSASSHQVPFQLTKAQISQIIDLEIFDAVRELDEPGCDDFSRDLVKTFLDTGKQTNKELFAYLYAQKMINNI